MTNLTDQPHLMDSFRDFYIRCVKNGRISIGSPNGGYYHSYKQKYFLEFLSQFEEDERKYIVNGIGSIPENITDRRLAKLLSDLSTEEIKQVIEELKEKDTNVSTKANRH